MINIFRNYLKSTKVLKIILLIMLVFFLAYFVKCILNVDIIDHWGLSQYPIFHQIWQLALKLR